MSNVFNLVVPEKTRMRFMKRRGYLTLGANVLYRGKIYEVIRDRDTGTYDIARVIERYPDGAPKIMTQEHRAIYGDELEVL